MNKWDQGKDSSNARSTSGNFGNQNYVPRYARAPAKFSPKRVVKSFRDLEVYQKTLECSVVFGKSLAPALAEAKFPLLEGMTNCALSIPLFVAEAHGMRFANFDGGVATLERAMQGCNKMIVYLEQSLGLYGPALDVELVQDLSSRYMLVRGKMLRLERSWQKFRGMQAPPRKAA